MTTETQPYEFLARFRDGKISGYHIQFIEVTKDDNGKEVFHKVLNPVPVDDANFPFADAMNLLNTAAIMEVQNLQTQNLELQNKMTSLEKYIPVQKQELLAEAQKRRDSALAEIAELEALN